MTDGPATAVSSEVNPDLGSLVATANRAAQWSATADYLKAQVSRARLAAFALTMIGATAATIAGQIPAEDASLRNSFAGAGAVALALVAFVTGRLLTTEHIKSWVKVRGAAEALKREAFRYAARAKPYDHPETAEDLLNTTREKIDADISSVVPRTPDRPGSSPRKMLSPDEYRRDRLEEQIGFYARKSTGADRSSKALRRVEFIIAIAATVITALSTITGKQIPLVGLSFDIAALTALLTTVGSATLAHIEASRLDYVATSYAATARRLEDLNVGYSKAIAKPQGWSDFVNRCEDIITDENQSWVAKWGPSSSPKP